MKTVKNEENGERDIEKQRGGCYYTGKKGE